MAVDTNVNICFFGLNRSLSFTINSIDKYLFEGLALAGLEYKVYGCFSQVNSFTNSRSSESDASIQNNEASLIDFAEIKYIDQNTLDDSIAWEKVFAIPLSACFNFNLFKRFLNLSLSSARSIEEY